MRMNHDIFPATEPDIHLKKKNLRINLKTNYSTTVQIF